MWLKEAHLPDLLCADTRGSDVGDCSGRKFETRIRSINTIRQDRNPDGSHVRHFNLTAYEPLHDVQIVNHQIEHNVYVQAARAEQA